MFWKIAGLVLKTIFLKLVPLAARVTAGAVIWTFTQISQNQSTIVAAVSFAATGLFDAESWAFTTAKVVLSYTLASAAVQAVIGDGRIEFATLVELVTSESRFALNSVKAEWAALATPDPNPAVDHPAK